MSKKVKNSILFQVSEDTNETPIMELRQNGDIFIKGRLIENDKEVVDAMRSFLNESGHLKLKE